MVVKENVRDVKVVVKMVAKTHVAVGVVRDVKVGVMQSVKAIV